jgi:CheY-like chemotaxis protein
MQIGVELSRALENRRIFIVMEDEILRAALQFMLHDDNEAHEIRDPEEACARAKSTSVDLVLLDMAFLWSRGVDLLANLQRDIPGAKFLLVAESANDPDAHACLSAGAVGIVGKPLTVFNVRRVVDIALGRTPAKIAA